MIQPARFSAPCRSDCNCRARRFYRSTAYNFECSCTSTILGRDKRGRFVDHVLTATIGNIHWWETNRYSDPADIAAVADLVVVFQRTGVARYRWNERRQEFVYSAAESDWTASQVGGSVYHIGDDDGDRFLVQNFDTLVGLATGDDPARRAWVRLALMWLGDSAVRTRLEKAIAKAPK